MWSTELRFLFQLRAVGHDPLGNVASNIHGDDDVGTCSGHKPAKNGTCMDYKHKGYMLSGKTFTFLNGISHQKVQAMEHFSENGLTVRTHGNSLKRPHNALIFGTI